MGKNTWVDKLMLNGNEYVEFNPANHTINLTYDNAQPFNIHDAAINSAWTAIFQEAETVKKEQTVEDILKEIDITDIKGELDEY